MGLWALLTAVGEVLVTWAPIFPVEGAEEARIVDGAFRRLMQFGLPVLTFVLAFLLYAVPRFRVRGPEQDGPPVRGHNPFVFGWIALTTGLTLLVIVYPGSTHLREVFARYEEEPDLVVRVEAFRWGWRVSYPELGIPASSELVLPRGKRTRFEITSRDVIHAFWVPAFRVKIDAVPGMTTRLSVVPTEEGSRAENPAYEVRCAELCGLGHTVMVLPVRVVPPQEFEAWVKEKAGS